MEASAEAVEEAPGGGRVVATVEPPRLRFRRPDRAVLGVLQIATDMVLDIEGALLVGQLPGVNLRLAKIAFDAEAICADTYEDAMAKGRVRTAADSLALPRGYVTLWGVACTSLSFLIGRDRLAAELPEGVRLVTMWDAVLAALRALGARRIALLTPYIDAVHARNVELLQEAGFSVARSMCLGLATDAETSEVEPSCVAECAQALAGPDLDAIFVGCSAFRACAPSFISELEAQVGRPVVTSTQAFLWHALRTAAVDDRLDGYGALFRDH